MTPRQSLPPILAGLALGLAAVLAVRPFLRCVVMLAEMAS